MPCEGCKFLVRKKAWRTRENEEWYELDMHYCFHKEAKAIKKPDKSGGVPVGYVCWTCRGYWRQL